MNDPEIQQLIRAAAQRFTAAEILFEVSRWNLELGQESLVMPKAQTEEIMQIKRVLQKRFKDVEAYRYNLASIRVRVVDDRFDGKSELKREAMVEPLLRTLPEEIQSDITLLLLVTREECKTSLLNLEFEQPSPSRL